MLLNKLFKRAPKIEIEALSTDSRKTAPNSVFFALKGLRYNGHQFIAQAIKNGAVAIVYSEDIKREKGIYYHRCEDVAKALCETANIFYDDPSKKMQVYGVTGTNGKTSVCSLIQQLVETKERCGYIGTLGVKIDGETYDTLLTTPGVVELNKYLSIMREKDIHNVAIEVSSIGLDQHRVDAIDFDVAIFTNLTHDHLDYHGNVNDYFKAKKRFFDILKPEAIAITNIDDPKGREIIADTPARVITFGKDDLADYRIENVVLKSDRTSFNLAHEGKVYKVATNLIAEFNVYNLSSAIITLLEKGYDFEQIAEKCKYIKGIEGRMHQIKCGQKFNCIVDFAHTPDGLEKIFQYARKITANGRIIGVFGSAGKRDVIKRHTFGQLADEYLDMLIITEDDPRDEKPEEIAKEIKSGIHNINSLIVTNRANAIEMAVDLMEDDDTLLILGKGDERFIYREFGKEYYDGDDVIVTEAIKKYLEERE